MCDERGDTKTRGHDAAPVIAAYAAIAIALCSLVVSVYSSWETRHHNRLTVKPALARVTGRDKDSCLVMTIKNVGFGPAKVEELYISWRGMVVYSTDSVRGTSANPGAWHTEALDLK